MGQPHHTHSAGKGNSNGGTAARKIRTWSGAAYPYSVCWAIPTNAFPLPLSHGVTDYSEAADRQRPQLYSMHGAYKFIHEVGCGNWGVLRFADLTHSAYALDLLLDADAKIPKADPVQIDLEGETYTIQHELEPTVSEISASLDVINPVVELLLNEYKVDDRGLSLIVCYRSRGTA